MELVLDFTIPLVAASAKNSGRICRTRRGILAAPFAVTGSLKGSGLHFRKSKKAEVHQLAIAALANVARLKFDRGYDALIAKGDRAIVDIEVFESKDEKSMRVRVWRVSGVDYPSKRDVHGVIESVMDGLEKGNILYKDRAVIGVRCSYNKVEFSDDR